MVEKSRPVQKLASDKPTNAAVLYKVLQGQGQYIYAFRLLPVLDTLTYTHSLPFFL